MNLLAINTGNTRSQIGLYLDDELKRIEHIAHDEMGEAHALLQSCIEQLQGRTDPAIYIASVNEASNQKLLDALQQIAGMEVQQVGRDVPIPLQTKLDPEAMVGVDRLVNAVAAFQTLKQACIVIDTGTATTVDFIDGEGTFHGGTILPGPKMMLQAMHQHTAQLPVVEFRPPDEPIGHNTQQAMRSGVFHGTRGAIREIVETFAEYYGAYPKVIATGGDAKVLFEEYPLIEAIVPDLTLQGIALCRKFVLSQDE